MIEAFLSRFYGVAFNREDQVPWSGFANLDDLAPIKNPVTACDAQHSIDLAAHRCGNLRRNLLGVNGNNAVDHIGQPRLRIVATQEGISRVKVDADGRA